MASGDPRVGTLRCRTCRADKPTGAFRPSELRRRDRNKQCADCGREAAIRRVRAKGVQPRVILSPEERRQKAADYNRRYHQENPQARRRSDLMRHYGITLEEFDAMHEAQEGLCAACGQPESRRTPSGGVAPLHVDHDHETGEVRGLLCQRCNFALGYAQEDPLILRGLIAYLEAHHGQ